MLFVLFYNIVYFVINWIVLLKFVKIWGLINKIDTIYTNIQINETKLVTRRNMIMQQLRKNFSYRTQFHYEWKYWKKKFFFLGGGLIFLLIL